ncbi:MAG: TolC family protein [Planctomycetales bacterium]|nr:TolC family protein [Planctomycetales bacterium]
MLADAFHRRIRFALSLAVSAAIGGCATPSARHAATTSPAPRAAVTVSSDKVANSLPDVRHAVAEEKPATSTDRSAPDVVQAEHVESSIQPPPAPASPTDSTTADGFAIDLPTVLRLAGGNNLQIALAVERVNQAVARSDAADVLWVPSLNAGVVYNHQNGRIQSTQGDIIETTRNSLFVGGGAGVANAPLNGGSGGPARMFVDLALVDVLFEPLAARQMVRASSADHTTTFNDTLLAVSLGWIELSRSHARLAIAEEAVTNATELARITADFARTGQGLQADADRAQAELSARQREVLRTQERIEVTSAELARLLRLDPTVRLHVAQPQALPLEFVEVSAELPALIEHALRCRPEITRAAAAIDETGYRQRQEQLRPLVPHLYAGVSGGGFGGGQGSSVNNFGDRVDFDVAAIWQLQNLGLGNRARQDGQASRHREAHLAAHQVRELVAMEVTQSHRQLQLRRDQIDLARRQVETARDALRHNLEGIRNGLLRPIEIQQAIAALATAQEAWLDSISDHNRSQFQLLRAIGSPPSATSNVDSTGSGPPSQ